MDGSRRVRPPAVAGTFYPADPAALRAAVGDAFAGAVAPAEEAAIPRALVVPHAGYVYSGPVAASAYLRIEPARHRVRRVVLLGPSHRVPLRGLALSSFPLWASPLGPVALDTEAAAALAGMSWVGTDDGAHRPEHSLEVQLPFLQSVLDDFELVPLVVGAASTSEVAEVIDALWSGMETIVIVSTDLSHYHRYHDAVRLDARTVAAIAALRPGDIADLDACGARPLRGLLDTAHRRQLAVETLDVRNSGDTAGGRDRVVGYGAFAIA
jgi:AmmeMemoRadiSam system protein B